MARGNILVTQLGYGWFATCFTGQESLSAPFNFNLTLAADSSQIKPDSLLGKNLTIQINDDHESRIFNGIVSTCKLGGIISDQLRECTCVLVPWFWFLQYDSDCRIFQDKTVIQIFNSLCKEKGFSDYNLNNLKGSYKPIPYCVQYNESTFAFLNRILASAGIYYYFTYQKDKHTMVLADNSTIAQQFAGSVVYTNSHSDEAHIHEWSSQDKLHANQFAQKDYDYNTPSNKLLALGKSNLPKTQVLNATKFEKFSYPGNDIKNITNFHDNQAQLFLGQGNYPSFRPGLNFNLSQHADKSQNSKYFLMSVEHSAADKTHFLENTGKHKDEAGQTYTNNFTCIPTALKYQPAELSKPSLNSTQTAMVVGPKQNEIYTDKLGRIKVRFHWDRNAPENSDDTTCWIRVSQQLADSNWGFQFIPRVGSEVIIDFLHGDPDRPSIIGSVHNAAQLPPYQYPNEQIKTGIKTRSIGQKTEGNELQFNDTKDAEQLNIHASKDYEKSVNKSTSVNINENSADKINNDRTIYSQKDHTIVINKQINIAAGKGEITVNPDSITLQAPRIRLGGSSGGAGAGAIASGSTSNIPIQSSTAPDNQEQDKSIMKFLVNLDQNNGKIPLQAKVNNINSKTLPFTTVYKYPLQNTQKTGPVHINSSGKDYTLVPNLDNFPADENNEWRFFIGALSSLAGKPVQFSANGITAAPPPAPDSNVQNNTAVLIDANTGPLPTNLAEGSYTIHGSSPDVLKWLTVQVAKVNVNAVPLVKDSGDIMLDKNKRALFLDNLFKDSQFYVKQIMGKWHIVFKNRHGKFNVTNATHYKIGNAKMGLLAKYADAQTLSKAGITAIAEDAPKEGMWGFILIAPIDIIKYYEDPDKNKELSDLFVQIGMDEAKYMIGWLGGIAVGAAFAAVLPVWLVVIVGVGVAVGISWGLDEIDKHCTHTTEDLKKLFKNTGAGQFINHPSFENLLAGVLQEADSSVLNLVFAG